MLRLQTTLGLYCLHISSATPALRAPFCSAKKEPSCEAGVNACIDLPGRRGSTLQTLRQAKLLHSRVVEDGDNSCHEAILHLYAQYGALEDAAILFTRCYHRSATNWARVIAAHGSPSFIVRLFHQMCTEGVIPTKPAVISILSSFSDSSCLAEAKRMHARIKNSSLCSDVVIATILIGIYSNCHCFDSARGIFIRIVERDAVVWVVTIRAYVQAGQCEDAFQLFRQMMMEGILPTEFVYASTLAACHTKCHFKRGQAIHCHIWLSEYLCDGVAWNALVTMYGKCGRLEDAITAFADSKEQDKVTWNAIVGACAQHDRGKDAVSYAHQMQERGFFPDDLTLLSVLDACAHQPAEMEGKKLHAQLVSMGLVDMTVSNAVLNMYGRCGSVAQARSVFDGMFQKDVITWTAMIAAYALHGLTEDAQHVFSMMVLGGGTPNSITYVNILSACGHSGLVKEGYEYFACMLENYITPTIEHYNCLLDLLGRAGLLSDGEVLLKHLPVDSTLALWTSLLGGCRLHFDVERGDYAASQALQFDSQEPGPYILLRNMVTASTQDESRTTTQVQDR
ncbi:hypothetical protein L7F22_035004 [Adiantum nelumboides]|nr:hypothetical protein [Adiantum nelumboides]